MSSTRKWERLCHLSSPTQQWQIKRSLAGFLGIVSAKIPVPPHHHHHQQQHHQHPWKMWFCANMHFIDLVSTNHTKAINRIIFCWLVMHTQLCQEMSMWVSVGLMQNRRDKEHHIIHQLTQHNCNKLCFQRSQPQSVSSI